MITTHVKSLGSGLVYFKSTNERYIATYLHYVKNLLKTIYHPEHKSAYFLWANSNNDFMLFKNKAILINFYNLHFSKLL